MRNLPPFRFRPAIFIYLPSDMSLLFRFRLRTIVSENLVRTRLCDSGVLLPIARHGRPPLFDDKVIMFPGVFFLQGRELLRFLSVLIESLHTDRCQDIKNSCLGPLSSLLLSRTSGHPPKYGAQHNPPHQSTTDGAQQNGLYSGWPFHNGPLTVGTHIFDQTASQRRRANTGVAFCPNDEKTPRLLPGFSQIVGELTLA